MIHFSFHAWTPSGVLEEFVSMTRHTLPFVYVACKNRGEPTAYEYEHWLQNIFAPDRPAHRPRVPTSLDEATAFRVGDVERFGLTRRERKCVEATEKEQPWENSHLTGTKFWRNVLVAHFQRHVLEHAYILCSQRCRMAGRPNNQANGNPWLVSISHSKYVLCWGAME